MRTSTASGRHPALRKRVIRPVGLLLVLAFVISVFSACEPAEPDDYKITVKNTVQEWNFNGETLTQGAPRGTTVTETGTYGIPAEEWEAYQANPYPNGQDPFSDPEFVNRDEPTAGWTATPLSGTISPDTTAARSIIHGGTASSAGCRSYTQDQSANSPLGALLYRFTQRYYWCWYLTTVYNQSMSRDITNITAGWSYQKLISSYTEYYNWGNFYHHKGGYRWYRKLEFKGYCVNVGTIITVTICQYRYPWLKFWAHANGTYSIDES